MADRRYTPRIRGAERRSYAILLMPDEWEWLDQEAVRRKISLNRLLGELTGVIVRVERGYQRAGSDWRADASRADLTGVQR